MTNTIEFENQVKSLIDDLKSILKDSGLGNTGFEYKIMSEVFAYKLLNDKLLRNLKEEFNYKEGSGVVEFINQIDEDEYNEFLDELDESTAIMNKEHFIANLYVQSEKTNEKPIHEILDGALTEISELNRSIFSIATAGGERKNLFDPISNHVMDSELKPKFAKAIIERLAEISFEKMFDESFDFFSVIFEYLVKDYNTDSGAYAEYYSPSFCGRILARIMVRDGEDIKNVKIYDPSSGCGVLLLTLANRIGLDKCNLYSQDISQKSTDFLRLNLILNGMTKSLENVIQGNTLEFPSHLESNNELMLFDYITANPPFKSDFSNSVEKLKDDPFNRFFAGVPNVPQKKKKGMPIYLMFIQHIIASLKDDGKACIIVPSGFCTDSSKIALKIREYLIENNYLEGIIQMPSNIFTNTGTNVSIMSINKAKENDDVILIDASNLGSKIKFEDGQRTILSENDEELIINTYHDKSDLDNFSKKVSIDKIKENSYQVNPGRYFDVKYEELLSGEELDSKINELINSLQESFVKSNELQDNVLKQLGGIVNE